MLVVLIALVHLPVTSLGLALHRAATESQLTEDAEGHLSPAAKKPHILFILVDDLGWAEAGFNRPKDMVGYPTPAMDKLADNGVILRRHYVHKFCSPTRSSIQTGRAPIHVNVQNALGTSHNEADMSGGFAGIPPKMTGMADVLRGAGYKTHLVGKWDAGWTTPAQLPAGKGYDTSLTYFSHETDCWTHEVNSEDCGERFDLWEHNESIAYPGQPAVDYHNSPECNYNNQTVGSKCTYTDALFEERVKILLQAHDKSTPMFLFWATHAVHGPYQPPQESTDKAREIKLSMPDGYRKYLDTRTDYYGSLQFMDDSIGRVTQVLMETGMWEDTLIVFSSDNGAVLGFDNRPIKGVKFSNWEGGIRVCTFVAGGFVPKAQRGSRLNGLIGGEDWYATFAELGGVDPYDNNAKAAGLPPVDSISAWSYISGASQESARTDLAVGTALGGYTAVARRRGEPMVGAWLQADGDSIYKVVLGEAAGDQAECNLYTGPDNNEKVDGMLISSRSAASVTSGVATDEDYSEIDENCFSQTMTCGSTADTGCLFDVANDPAENNNLAQLNPGIFNAIMDKIILKQKHVYAPDRGRPDLAACNASDSSFFNHLGPYVSLVNS